MSRYAQIEPQELKPHPANQRIYGTEPLSDEMVESIRSCGVIEPILVTPQFQIVSGHRRCAHAIAAGCETVGIVIRDFPDEISVLETLVEGNRQREKTFSQKMMEAEVLAEIEQARARERQQATQAKPGQQVGSQVVDTFPPRDAGKSRDAIATTIGIGSGRTYDRAREVWTRAKQGDETATNLVAKLDAGEVTISRAHGEIKKAKRQKERAAAIANAVAATPAPPTLRIGDCMDLLKTVPDQSIDLLITDPPYMIGCGFGDALKCPGAFQEFVEAWVPLAMAKVKDSGRALIFSGPYPEEIMTYVQTLSQETRFEFPNILVWTYRNTMGPLPKMRFKNNWQACYYLHGNDAPPLEGDSLNDRFSVQDISTVCGLEERHHAWQKPEKLAKRLISQTSKETDAVLDPFAGTGTFIVVAGQMGRIAIGFEASPEMAKVAGERGVKIERQR